MKSYIVGNWKMNQSLKDVRDFFSVLDSHPKDLQCEAWLAPQFIHLGLVKELAGQKGKIQVGAQNCGPAEKGAFTGEVSPVALSEIGAQFTITGHSERRTHFKESHELLRRKNLCALQAGLQIIFCVGESLEEREQKKAFEVVQNQIEQGLKDIPVSFMGKILVAYEPVWAIGTGVTATPLQAQEMHAFIRGLLQKIFPSQGSLIPILYGGSVNPSNIRELMGMKDIDGALVGGASLRADDYLKLCEGSIGL